MVTRAAILCISVARLVTADAGPYMEMGVNGYIDPATRRHADPADAAAVLNPIFRGWATGVAEYAPSDQTWSGLGTWNDPAKALGPATGQNFDIVSLGELDRNEIDSNVPPGYITLVFGDPCDPNAGGGIRNGRGYDFAVFENAFISEVTTSLGSAKGQMIAELAYVEVSSNGVDFARFSSVSLTPGLVKSYGTIEVSNVHNLAGKHPNANGRCVGTPFDLDDLADHPSVLSGAVDLNDIRFVRIVDIPGSGDFLDEASSQTDPAAEPGWRYYAKDHPIYDAWPTVGSGGFDLEAVGVLHEQQYSADINLDGKVDLLDLMLLASTWNSHFGQERWIGRCDLAEPKDLSVDSSDFAVFAAQWRREEPWRAEFGHE